MKKKTYLTLTFELACPNVAKNSILWYNGPRT